MVLNIVLATPTDKAVAEAICVFEFSLSVSPAIHWVFIETVEAPKLPWIFVGTIFRDLERNS